MLYSFVITALARLVNICSTHYYEYGVNIHISVTKYSTCIQNTASLACCRRLDWSTSAFSAGRLNFAQTTLGWLDSLESAVRDAGVVSIWRRMELAAYCEFAACHITSSCIIIVDMYTFSIFNHTFAFLTFSAACRGQFRASRWVWGVVRVDRVQ